MEFDCRVDNPDAVAFEAKVTLPKGDVVNLQFRDYAQIPGRISMYNIGDNEAQLWAALNWGLITPEHWPQESKRAGVSVFEDIPAKTAIKIHEAWQKKAGVSAGESPASAASSESTESS